MSRPPAANPALVARIRGQIVAMRRRRDHNPGRGMAPRPDGKPRVRWLGGGD